MIEIMQTPTSMTKVGFISNYAFLKENEEAAEARDVRRFQFP
jgi:hypothetical protein